MGTDSIQLLVDGVEGAALDVALDPAQIFPDEGEDESLHREDAEHEPGRGKGARGSRPEAPR